MERFLNHGGVFLRLIVGVALSATTAIAADNSQDIAVIDRALATEKPGDEWIKFGDVGLTRRQLQIFRDRLVAEQQGEPSSTPQPKVVTPPTTFTWPSGNVYYRFDPTQVSNNTITPAKMQAFRDGVAEWAAFANLHFIEFTTPLPTNYITVQDDPSRTGGFSSSVGMKQTPGEQLIQIGSTSWNRGTVCHEVGHSIGLYHEQQRDDRDTYVVINTNNINTNDQGNFARLPGGTTAIGAYDFYSVMHYSRAALTNKTGTPNPNAPDPSIDTIDPIAPYLSFLNIMGNVYDRTLSKLDRSGMAQIYANPSPPPSAVVTNTKDSGSGSLRAAIYYAFDKSTDAPPVPTTVTFHIPTTDPNYNASTGVFTIRPTYLMTSPGDGTTVDGTTQTAFTGDTNPNGPEIVLDGTSQKQYEFAGVFGPAFILRQANCTVKGFVIQNFDNWGIQITNNTKFGSIASGNVVSGCYIGTDQNGSVGMPNGIDVNGVNNHFSGIEISNGAHNNTIGGTSAAARNVISANTGYGVYVHDPGSTNNLIEGNYVGLTAAGTGALSNGFGGVTIRNGAASNTIGGTVAGAGNVISGNTGDGVPVGDANSNNNVVQGNVIGLKADGTAAVTNSGAGVDIFTGPQSTIVGGTSSGARNIISGNTASGVIINASNGTLVQGNYIGMDPLGTTALGNNQAGVYIFASSQNTTVGGTTAAARNIISGNTNDGVDLNGVSNTTVQGNYIGLDVSGTVAKPNGGSGVALFSAATSNTIGGTIAGARNIVSGNTGTGVFIGGSGTNLNTVQGNYIGTDANGTTALPNANEGVGVFLGAQSNTIGGTVPGARNVIATGSNGVDVLLSDSGTSANVVLGNFIGIDATGTFAIAGANSSGVGVQSGAQNNLIGGTTGGSRNFICGHPSYGIYFSGTGTTGNSAQGNTVGLNFASSAVANSRGVAFFSNAQSNTVGGSPPGASNIVSGSTNEGVVVYGASSTTIRETFSRNSIYGNGTANIALYNNGNNAQPAPTSLSGLVSTGTNPNGTDVSGTLNATASTAYTLEFFANPMTDPFGFDGGHYFVGIGSAITNAAGTVNFTVSLAAVIPTNYAITATATDPNGNTSQFSSTGTVTLTTDTDSDGIPDNWMNAHFGHATGQASDRSRATDDADGTGMTNLQKFYAGLDPKNPNSVFRISSILPNSGNIQISFPSILGKTYQLQYRDDFLSGSWLTMEDQISGTGASVQLLDPSAAGVTKRFYRLSIEP